MSAAEIFAQSAARRLTDLVWRFPKGDLANRADPFTASD